MELDKKLVADKLRRWRTYLLNYRLPDWENIPDFGLYMEQVLVLLKQYLDYFPPELKEEQFITAATINNYVRKKIMPEPIRKRYYRSHIAYLLIICSLKQSLSISLLQRLFPLGLSEEELREQYSAYAARQHLVTQYFVEQVEQHAAGLLEHEPVRDISTDDPQELILTVAVASGFARLMAEKLILLDGEKEE